MSDSTERCALCNFPLDESASTYTEGKFCTDVAGCRRRALRIIARLQVAYRELLKIATKPERG